MAEVDKTIPQIQPGIVTDTSTFHTSINNNETESRNVFARDIARLQSAIHLYDPAKFYELDDVVRQDGISYYNIVPITIVEAFNFAKWKQLAVPIGASSLYVTSQVDLTAQLGGSLVIPASSNMTIHFLNSMVFTSFIEIGAGATVEFISEQNLSTITYVGTGEFIRNETTGTGTVRFTNVAFQGDGTNTFCDIELIPFLASFVINECQLTAFRRLGTVNGSVFLLTRTAHVSFTIGWIVKNPIIVSVENPIIQTFGGQNPTLISTIAGAAPVQSYRVDKANYVDNDGGDSLAFIDPNAVTGSLHIVANNILQANTNLFQPGTPITVTSSVSGGALFTDFTAIAHGFQIGQVIVHDTDFAQVINQGTFEVTDVIDNDTYQLKITFVSTDAGTADATSLDHESVIVDARNNPGKPNSQIICEARTGATLRVDGSGMVDVPVVDISPTAGDWIGDITNQRFTVDTSTGLITYIGLESVVGSIRYQLTAAPFSGGNQIIEFDIHINGIQETKSIITIDTADVGVGSFIGGNFSLSTGDTVQLFKNNLTNTTDTNVSVATILIST